MYPWLIRVFVLDFDVCFVLNQIKMKRLYFVSVHTEVCLMVLVDVPELTVPKLILVVFLRV